jgi:hypothetical protein
VGAGLVAVLFVLAVTTVGDSGSFARLQIPGWLAVALAMACTGILGWLLQSTLELSPATSSEPLSFARTFWEQRTPYTFTDTAPVAPGSMASALMPRAHASSTVSP